MPLRSKQQAFDEFKAGTLHSGKGGPIVRKRSQAIAIALNADRRATKRKKSKKGAMAAMLAARFKKA